jgi:hypothetical protein
MCGPTCSESSAKILRHVDRLPKPEITHWPHQVRHFWILLETGIAKKLGIHWRMVREAVLSAVPVERKTPLRERPKLEPAMAFIDAVLEADKKAPRKQRHTAHRIWCRIRAEMPAVEVAESTIRRYVRERKIQLALVHRETFIPQSYVRGGEAQVDW